jgi:arabinoxylan arabinofuranohydrolase
LYYVLDALKIVSVAVCDEPAGRYEFLGYVRYPDGTYLGEKEGDEPNFDPGVLCEGDKVYLYSGFCPIGMKSRTGPFVTILEPDMLTVKQAPVNIAPSEPFSRGSGFEGHEFFEASSIRKVGDKYYFIYSSVHGHELCYAVSSDPAGRFRFMGTIVSNVDKGIGTYKDPDRHMAFIDNNHGSIEKINGKWYVFYHRHTNSHSFSRQGCIESIEILPDGTIPQAEMTSCGPDPDLLKGEGEYPGYLACNIFCNTTKSVGMEFPGRRWDTRFPYITQDGCDGDEISGHVANMQDGACAGFKYFDCSNTSVDCITVRGWCFGVFEILNSPDGDTIASIPIVKTNEWKRYDCDIPLPDGKQAIYFRYKGRGYASLGSFSLKSKSEKENNEKNNKDQ